MSIYGHLNCHDCRQTLWLGKALHRDGQSLCFHRGGENEPPHWQRERLNQVLWKFLADHTGHRIDVQLEQDIGEDMWTYQEIGGNEAGDIDFDAYLAGWRGMVVGTRADGSGQQD